MISMPSVSRLSSSISTVVVISFEMLFASSCTEDTARVEMPWAAA